MQAFWTIPRTIPISLIKYLEHFLKSCHRLPRRRQRPLGTSKRHNWIPCGEFSNRAIQFSIAFINFYSVHFLPSAIPLSIHFLDPYSWFPRDVAPINVRNLYWSHQCRNFVKLKNKVQISLRYLISISKNSLFFIGY